MLVIEIKDGNVDEKRGTFDDGRPWVSRQQVGYAHLPGKPYPVEVKVKLGDKPGYAPGRYQIAPSSFFVKNGALTINKLDLVALPAKAAV